MKESTHVHIKGENLSLASIILLSSKSKKKKTRKFYWIPQTWEPISYENYKTTNLQHFTK